MRYIKYIVFSFLGLLLFLNINILFADGNFGFGMEHENIKARQDIKIGGVQENQEENILDIVKSVVNRTLGILALIALILILWGGLQMVTAAGNEEKYKKGWTILKTASLGLLFIGLAWFILSLIFWLIVKTSDGVGSANTLG